MIEEIKNKIEDRLKKFVPDSNINDIVINTLRKDHIGDFMFQSNLRILSYELVENAGVKILQSEKEFAKYFKPEFDPFFIDWSNHHYKYWQDKFVLMELYSKLPSEPLSYKDSFMIIAEQIKKIERRALLLTPEAKSVTQKQTRLTGEKKEYDVLRAYWIDDRGERKRIISRHIGDKHQRLEKEIAQLFISRGYGVLWQYRSDAGYQYDMVIERDRMRSVVEVKAINEEVFDQLFLFDELLKRFAQDYPEERL